MAVKWEKVEKNIYRSTDEKNKYRVDLYFGRDKISVTNIRDYMAFLKTEKTLSHSLNHCKKQHILV